MAKMTRPEVAQELDRLITRKEAAKLAGLSAGTLSVYAVRRVGPPVFKRGATKQSRTLYRERDVREWLASITREGAR